MYDRFQWTEASVQRIALLRAYEPIQPYLLTCLADQQACETFLDVGANIGAYSMFLSLVPTIKEVHAFEPSPQAFQELQKNVALNSLQATVVVHQRAVSNSGGSIEFGIVKDLSGANSVVSTSIHKSNKFRRQIQVERVRLDDLLGMRGRSLCLKIDIEGHERDALLGMRDLLSENSSLIQIEHHGTGADYMDILIAAGFRCLFQLGPDLYLTNAKLSDQDVIVAFERASTLMIGSSKKLFRASQPMNVRVGRWANLELRGPVIDNARAARAALRRLFNR
jgi:FkbM family methyltransferase